jgi:glycosyltransferase involved in cell wall biosynthesis
MSNASPAQQQINKRVEFAKKPIRLAIIVPCYNEEEVLRETNACLSKCLIAMQASGLASLESAVYFVDDGSTDRTWDIIQSLAATSHYIHGIKLSRNRGHQSALLAGLLGVEGDALVTVDADLQDDVTVIEEMVRVYLEGIQIVYGARKSRSTDTGLKRGTAMLYYKILKWMGVDIVYNHADYRLMGRQAVEALRQYSEVNLFLRGVIPLIGFPSRTVYYDRGERYAGLSKYSLGKMIGLAIDGITSFSVVPLRLITLSGFLVSAFSFAMVAWVFYGTTVKHVAVPGWASSVIPIYFLGGIQLMSIGILGEYVGKIYIETKRRPRYFIEKVI